MSDIFISYASEDLERITPLVRALEGQGWSVFWDRTIPVGKTWREFIRAEIDSCRAMVVVWSAHSIESNWVQEEADEARQNGRLTPVLIDDVIPPMGFRSIQAAKLGDWDGQSSSHEFQRLCIDITRLLDTGSAGDAPATEPTTAPQVAQTAHRTASGATSTTSGNHTIADTNKIKKTMFVYGGLVAFIFIAVAVGLMFGVREPDTISENGTSGTGVGKHDGTDTQGQTIPPATTAVSKKQDWKPGQVFRDSLRDGSSGPEMVVIPAGSFRMGDLLGNGDKNETPIRKVNIEQAFAMGRFEVTLEEYDKYVRANTRVLPIDDAGWGMERRPMMLVRWESAVSYAKWLSEQTGAVYRLPSEAEWEYAARAGQESAYWWGENIHQDDKYWANCQGCGSKWDDQQTAPVGSFTPNAFGLFDTAGNVREWVADCWNDSLQAVLAFGRAWDSGGMCNTRVLRGGGWKDKPSALRASKRVRMYQGARFGDIGFRLVRELN